MAPEYCPFYTRGEVEALLFADIEQLLYSTHV